MTDEDTIEQRWRALEERVGGLGATLDALTPTCVNERGVANRSMRETRTCPACGTHTLLHTREVLDRADGPRREIMAIWQPSVFSNAGVGRFEAWICTRCGLVEWYVPDLSLVDVDGHRWRILEGQLPDEKHVEDEPADIPPRDESKEATRARCGAALEARIRGLRERIQRLRGQVARDAGLDPTLGTELRCPACAETRVLHASQVLDRAELGRDKMTLTQPSFLYSGGGQFEAMICTSCGLVEWRIPDLTGVEPDGEKLRLIENEPPGSASPYR